MKGLLFISWFFSLFGLIITIKTYDINPKFKWIPIVSSIATLCCIIIFIYTLIIF